MSKLKRILSLTALAALIVGAALLIGAAVTAPRAQSLPTVPPPASPTVGTATEQTVLFHELGLS